MVARDERKESTVAEQEHDPRRSADEALVAAWMAALEGEFGERFDDAARAEIRAQLAQQAANSRVLAAYALANAQEPASTFSARQEG